MRDNVAGPEGSRVEREVRPLVPTRKSYAVWRRYHSECTWRLTGHTIDARTEKEAAAKLRRRFSGAGFSSMSLITMAGGKSPNAPTMTPSGGDDIPL